MTFIWFIWEVGYQGDIVVKLLKPIYVSKSRRWPAAPWVHCQGPRRASEGPQTGGKGQGRAQAKGSGGGRRIKPPSRSSPLTELIHSTVSEPLVS